MVMGSGASAEVDVAVAVSGGAGCAASVAVALATIWARRAASVAVRARVACPIDALVGWIAVREPGCPPGSDATTAATMAVTRTAAAPKAHMGGWV